MLLEWTPEAIKEVNTITAGLFDYSPEAALDVRNRIVKKCVWLAGHAIAGSNIKGLLPEYRRGYAIRTTYKIYYQELGPDHIKILMVRHSRRKEPANSTIKRRSK
jgi:plasmid stabilization system protein ParE